MSNPLPRRFQYRKHNQNNDEYDRIIPRKQWPAEEVARLREAVEKMRAETGHVDWLEIAAQFGAVSAICYNKYYHSFEKEWTETEDAALRAAWERDWKDFRVDDVLPTLPGHSRRGVQFRLEKLTRHDGAEGKPVYQMGKLELMTCPAVE